MLSRHLFSLHFLLFSVYVTTYAEIHQHCKLRDMFKSPKNKIKKNNKNYLLSQMRFLVHKTYLELHIQNTVAAFSLFKTVKKKKKKNL